MMAFSHDKSVDVTVESVNNIGGLADDSRSTKPLEGLVRKNGLFHFQDPLRWVINPSLMATLSLIQTPISL